MTRPIFITGTGTGVGKTVVTGLLARDCLSEGSVVTQKWIQTGCNQTIPDDIATHWSYMGRSRDDYAEFMADICPYQLPFPASPHLAAEKAGVDLDYSRLADATHRLCASFETVICEGAGGALVPVNRTTYLIDWVNRCGFDVVLVIANQLGCINHAMLTIEALNRRQTSLVGLIFNHPNPNEDPDILADNQAIILAQSKIPLIREVPYD